MAAKKKSRTDRILAMLRHKPKRASEIAKALSAKGDTGSERTPIIGAVTATLTGLVITGTVRIIGTEAGRNVYALTAKGRERASGKVVRK